MPDRITANLPSRDFIATKAFYRRLGFRIAIPRLTGIFKLQGAPRMFALVDEDGALLRVLDNKDS